MDILISSNLERLIYTIAGEDASVVNELMEGLQTEGQYSITKDMKAKLDAFYPAFATEAMTQEAIKDEFEDVNYMLDPHTAVAKVAFDQYIDETKDITKTVIVSTASPYKFTKSTLVALDDSYENIDDFELLHELYKVSKVDIPEAVKDIEKRSILHSTVCEKDSMADVVLNFLKK